MVARMGSIAWIALILGFGLTACVTEVQPEGSGLSIPTTGAADSWGTSTVSEIRYPIYLHYFTEDLYLAPNEMIAIAYQGEAGLPMRVSAEHESGMWNYLRMALMVGDDPRGEDAELLDDAGQYWFSPALTIEEPEDGRWYFFILRNDGSDSLRVTVHGDHPDNICFSFVENLYVGQPRCGVKAHNLLQYGGFQLLDLEPGKTYSVVANGDIERMVLFEGEPISVNYSVFETRQFSPFETTQYWPTFDNNNPHGIADDDDDSDGFHLTFEAQEGMLYAIGLEPSGIWLTRSYLGDGYIVDAWLCEGVEPCPARCN